MNKKTILVWRSAALGDFILACPAFYELRRNFPNHRIILLTMSSGDKKQKEKIEMSYLDKDSNTFPWIGFAVPSLIDDCLVVKTNISLYKMVYSIRQRLVDESIDFSILMLDPCAPWLGRIKKITLMKFISPLKKVVGWRAPGSLNSKLSDMKKKGYLKHHIHGPLQFLKEIKTKYGYPGDKEINFSLDIKVEGKSWALDFFNKNNLNQEKTIIIGPGAIHEHKMWPIENYIQLVDYLIKELDYSLIILGTKLDYEKGETLKKVMNDRIFNLCGQTDIQQSAALMSCVAIFVGNDGGAAHLADAVGCKVISIVPGIEYADSIEPWFSKQYAIRKKVSCSPCYNFTTCNGEIRNACMSGIELNTVKENLLKVIENDD